MSRTTKRRRTEQEEEEEDYSRGSQLEQQRGDQVDYISENEDARESDNGTAQAVKKLVRYALACEYSRTAIKRADITSKVLASGRGGKFKQVFEQAQEELRETFGMEMVELPMKEKITVQERRAAQQKEKQSSSTNMWILSSILPARYRIPDILAPPRVPIEETESAYVALYTFLISTIYLTGGTLPDSKMSRCLARTNVERSTPVGETDKTLMKMIKEGYLVRIRDHSSGEEIIDWTVGQRGKEEVGLEGVKGMVRAVYGEEEGEELESRLNRSLGLNQRPVD